MTKKYSAWDKQNDIYRGRVTLTKEDREAQRHGEPTKFIVPMSFAQIQTFVSFIFLLLTQKQRFYELNATGPEDHDIRECSEEILERDLRRNHFNSKLYQNILDIGRFGMGVFKHWWDEETQYVPVSQGDTAFGANSEQPFEQGDFTSLVEMTKYQGNKIQNISPYNFFPDTRFPLTEYRRGAFVADEMEYHISQLKKWEKTGRMFGVDHIEPVAKDFILKRGGDTRLNGVRGFADQSRREKHDQMVCITTYQGQIVPKTYDLGKQEHPINCIVTIANDQRIVDVRPSGYLHDEYIYDLGLYSYDSHQVIGESLSDIIEAMQDCVSFLFNSRMNAVKKSLDNNMIIDPTSVDMTTVESRSPWILLKKGAARLGVDKFVRQLNFVDTTGTNLADADAVLRIMQLSTGVNENAMGQFHGGRRSATEARAANDGAASRMKTLAAILWPDCYASMGRKLLFNSRQGISPETFAKIVGEGKAHLHSSYSPQDPTSLVGAEDHFVFDSVLGSEKGFIAQSLQDLVTAIISNPVVMQVLPLDIGKLMEEILQLRGVDDLERFRIQPATPQNAIGTILGPNGTPTSETQTAPVGPPTI
jgi:hypothetical protein